jgi:hypothetical protein
MASGALDDILGSADLINLWRFVNHNVFSFLQTLVLSLPLEKRLYGNASWRAAATASN